MKKINVSLIKQVDDSYDIYIQNGLLKLIPNMLAEKQLGSKILIITDSHVKILYGETLYQSLQDKGLDTYLFSFPAGEKQKNIKTKLDIEKFMFEHQFGRDSTILALGGGVVGDIAGFTASTFNRGIPYIQIPTTILAQVDSSIGGKTAIDVPYGKNLIGSFYQPKIVFIDPLVLQTLSEKEYCSGLAEVIKHAIILDKELFYLLKKKRKALIDRDIPTLETVIERNCHIKRTVVEKDEKESNFRKVLNFGHTIGHAVEKVMNYQLLHGECVAMGIAVESEISNKLGYLSSSSVKEIEDMILCFSLPNKLPKKITKESLYQATLLDKKSIKNESYYSLPKRIGEMLQVDDNFVIKVKQSIIYDAIQKKQIS